MIEYGVTLVNTIGEFRGFVKLPFTPFEGLRVSKHSIRSQYGKHVDEREFEIRKVEWDYKSKAFVCVIWAEGDV